MHAAPPENEEMSFFSLLCILNQFKKWLIGIPLLAVIVAALVMFGQPDRYTAELKIRSVESSSLLAAVSMPQIAGLVEQRLQLIAYYHLSSLAELSARLQQTVKVTEEKEKPGNNPQKEKMLTISATDTDAKMAAAIANAYAEALLEVANAQRLTAKGKTVFLLETQLTEVRKQLVAHTAQIDRDELDKTLSQLPSTARFAVDTLASLQAEAAILTDGEVYQQKKRDEGLLQDDALRLATVMSTVAQLLPAQLGKGVSHDEALYHALTLEHRRVFLSTLEQKLLRRIHQAKIEMRQDTQMIAQAEVPSAKSGPARIKTISAVAVLAAVLSGLGVLLLVSMRRAKRAYAQSTQIAQE